MSSRYTSSTSGHSSNYTPQPNSLASTNTTATKYSNRTAPRGLPFDEYKTLQKLQDRSRLETHFQHRGSNTATSSRPRTTYQSRGIPRERRAKISEVKYATRAALGASFDFTDTVQEKRGGERRYRSRYDEPVSRRYEEPVPQRYIDEYNLWSLRDDLEYDGAAYGEDYTFGARARMHESMQAYEIPIIPVRPVVGCDERVGREQQVEASQQAYEEARQQAFERPQLKSRFSFDSTSTGEPVRWRDYFRRSGKEKRSRR